MPTNKPKLSIVISDMDNRRLIELAVADLCVIHGGTSQSWEIEQIIMKALLPESREARASVKRLYSGRSVADELAGMLGRIGGKVNTDGRVFPSEERWRLDGLAGMQADGVACRNNGSRLARVLSKDAHVYWEKATAELDGADEVIARRLLAAFANGGPQSSDIVRAQDFFTIFKRNWNQLGTNPFAYAALGSVIRLCPDWPNDAQARRDYILCIGSGDGEEY